MVGESRRAERYSFTAAAEVEHSAVMRKARVKDFCLHGCYLAMPDSFSKGALVRIKIRTEIEFFQADATVAHATHGLGMGVLFHAVSPPFLIVLQYWLSEAHQVSRQYGRTKQMSNFLNGGAVTDTKKPYVPPRLTVYDPKNVPESLNLIQQDLLKGAHVPPNYTIVVDQDRKYVNVSESFCELVGYKREELIGTRYDHLTALNTADIPTTYNLLSRFGYMHGLWMLVHRTGYRILIRYEAWLRPDTNIQSNIEVVRTIV